MIFRLVGEWEAYEPVFDHDGIEVGQGDVAELGKYIVLQVAPSHGGRRSGERSALCMLPADPFAAVP